MAERIKNVVVAGPNGTLGDSVIRHLQKHNFNTTLLTRNLQKTNDAFRALKAFEAKYDSPELLTILLRKNAGPQDALVILINRNELQAQINIMEAAVAADIPHIIPSSFGIGSRDPTLRITPVWETKVQMEDYVVRKAEEGSFTFTGVQTGVFFDWALDNGVFLNTKNPDTRTMVFDGGDVPFSVTVVDDIGRAVAAVLLRAERFKNEFVFVHSAIVTQNQLLAYARETAPETDFKVLNLDTAELERQAWEKYNAGDRGPEVLRGFMPRATFWHRMGLFETVDNGTLGIGVWSENQVREFVAGYVLKDHNIGEWKILT